jgi:hypothetical protein
MPKISHVMDLAAPRRRPCPRAQTGAPQTDLMPSGRLREAMIR